MCFAVTSLSTNSQEIRHRIYLACSTLQYVVSNNAQYSTSVYCDVTKGDTFALSRCEFSPLRLTCFCLLPNVEDSGKQQEAKIQHYCGRL